MINNKVTHMIRAIKPAFRATLKAMITIYSILLLLSVTLTSLVFFNVITPDIFNLSISVFSILYLKLKCMVWLLFFIGIFYSMITSNEKHHFSSFSEDSFLFFVVFCSIGLSIIILQPLPQPLF